MKRTLYIITLTLYLTALMALGRLAFLVYNRDVEFFTLRDVLECEWHALPFDLSVVAVMVIPVWLLTALTLKWHKMPLRWVAGPYLAVVVFASSCITAGTLIMYENWKFLLDASVFSYMSSPGNAGASASLWYIVSRLGLGLSCAVLFSVVAVLMTPSRIVQQKAKVKPLSPTSRWTFVFMGVLLAVMVWGINGRRADEHSAFYSDKLLLSHAAVNPVGHMACSILLYQKDFSEQFRYDDEQSCRQRCESLFPSMGSADSTLTILSVKRPNVLTIQLESFGAPFVEALGGAEGVAPEISEWMRRSVWFANAYAASFRTDRGTVCALNGFPPFPTRSPLLEDSVIGSLPSIAKTLKGLGYSTDYIYGGNALYMNKGEYLCATGYDKVWDIDDLDVPSEVRTGWGANDSVALERTLALVGERNASGKPYYIGMQTIDSHEPFDVPYHRLDNKVYNAFAYTDHCVGHFLNELSKTEAWKNLVVVIFADHGHTYNTTYADAELFHMPLFFTGGAIKESKRIDVLTSQSDIAATLFAQMGIDHAQFPWSRNVLSSSYSHQFVYANYPSGVLLRDASGTTIYDISADATITADPTEGNEQRINDIKTLLQGSYGGVRF